MSLLRRVEDQLLCWLQRRCDHPDRMVSADILEGCSKEIEIPYCNRCGAVRTDWFASTLPHDWRLPDPNLWRG